MSQNDFYTDKNLLIINLRLEVELPRVVHSERLFKSDVFSHECAGGMTQRSRDHNGRFFALRIVDHTSHHFMPSSESIIKLV